MNKYLYKIKDLEIPIWIKRWFLKRSRGQIVEVEGVPPITFQGIGENLLDYRIDGASGGVGERTNNLFDKKNTEIIHAYFSPENLWQVNEDSSSIIIKVRPNTQYTLSIGTAISIFRIYKTSLENPEPGKNNVFTPIIRSSNINTYTFTTDNDTTYIIFQGTNADTEMWINSLILNIGSTSLPDYEPYGYKVPVIISGKNLLPTPEVKSQTESGVTISRFANGIITIKGTPTAQMDVKFNFEESTFSAGSYIHLRNNLSTYNFAVSFRKDGVNKIAPSLGKLNSIQRITEDITVNQMVVLCNNNAIGTNYDITIQPSIELTNEETSYEPYHEPITTNIYLDNPIRTVEDEVEYIDYSEQKQHRVRKNLLQNTATTQTKNGVTFTVNEDKSISCNGTASSNVFFKIGDIQLEENCIMSGCPAGGANNSYVMRLYNNGSVFKTDSGEGVLINSEIQNGYAEIRIAAGYTCDNLTFYPMIRLAEIEDNTYEPYIENTEVDVTLPAIPTLDGTNTLSIGTTVQPSNVYIKTSTRATRTNLNLQMKNLYSEIQFSKSCDREYNKEQLEEIETNEEELKEIETNEEELEEIETNEEELEEIKTNEEEEE